MASKGKDPTSAHAAASDGGMAGRAGGKGNGEERGSRVPIDDAQLGRLILDSALDYAIVTLSVEGLVTSWSEGAERIMGWPEDEILGRSVELFFTESDNAVGRADIEMREAAGSGRARDERYHMRRDGSRFYADGMMVPLRRGRDGMENAVIAADGPIEQPSGFLKIFRDRTHAHETEIRARELETGVAMALRASGSIGLYRFDPAARIVWGDESCARMFDLGDGGLGDGMPAERFFERIHPNDVERVDELQERSAVEGAHLDITFRVVHRDGTTRWVHTLSDFNPPDDDGAEGDGTGYASTRIRSGMMIDVTNRQREDRMRIALLEIGDRLRDMDDPGAMGALASEVIGQTLDLSRAGHGEMTPDGDAIMIRDEWNAGGSDGIAGSSRSSELGVLVEPLLRGETLAIEDARSDDRVSDPSFLDRIKARALLNVPLVERGRVKAVLFANDDRPRAWTESEIAFVRGVFDRTYAAIERVRAVGERELINRELAHRMKNVLTIAQVVATQSLRHAPSLAEGQRQVAERLAALARAQDMLTVDGENEIAVRSVIEDAMLPHVGEGDPRVTLEGPHAVLSASQVLGLSLAVHELATNAGKYGALAGDAGRVDVSWSIDPQNAFTFAWSERGAPGYDASRESARTSSGAAKGFGSTLLERVVGSYFDGRSTLQFDRRGANFTIEGRLDQRDEAPAR